MVDVLQAVAEGHYEHIWAPIISEARGNRAKLWVSADALKVDGIRVSVDADTHQRIADLLGAHLCTTKVMDLSWDQADIRIRPKLQHADFDQRRASMNGGADPGMSSDVATKIHSLDIDMDMARGFLARNVGKHWVLSDRCNETVAANYGWYDKAAPDTSWSHYKMWQTLGTRHNHKHWDYSQTVVLMRNDLEINGVKYWMDDVLVHPEFSWLVNDDGKMRITRLPGVSGRSPAPPPAEPPPVLVLRPDLPNIKFVQAKNYTKGRIKPIELVVIHTMEAAEKPTTAENVAAWFAGAAAPQASAHYCIDNDSIVQSVLEKDTAWHAPGANANGIGLEHAGYAKQSVADWSDTYSSDMLALSARLAADICKRHNLPIEFVDEAGLLAGKRGITTHAAVSKAFKRSTHIDPGPNFPMSAYLDAVRKAMP